MYQIFSFSLLKLTILIAASLFLAACGDDVDEQVDPQSFARVTGTISLQPASDDVSARLQNNSVVETTKKTVLSSAALSGSVIARTNYSLSSGNDVSALADYELLVPLVSDQVRVSVEPLIFADGSQLQLGSFITNSPQEFLSGTLQSISENPDGLQVNPNSCVTIQAVDFQITADTTTLSALEDAISCQIKAVNNQTNREIEFARSANYSFSIEALNSQTAPDIVIPTDIPLSLQLTCLMTPVPGERGFASVPGFEQQNLTAFSASTPEITARCEGEPVVLAPLNLRVERNATRMVGNLDLLGYNEQRTIFRIAPETDSTVSPTEDYPEDSPGPYELELPRIPQSSGYSIDAYFQSFYNSSLEIAYPLVQLDSRDIEPDSNLINMGNRYISNTRPVSLSWQFLTDTFPPNDFQIMLEEELVESLRPVRYLSGHETRFELEGIPGLYQLPDDPTTLPINGQGASSSNQPLRVNSDVYIANLPIFALSPPEGDISGEDSGVMEWTYGTQKLRLASETSNMDQMWLFRSIKNDRFLNKGSALASGRAFNQANQAYQPDIQTMCFARYKLNVQAEPGIYLQSGRIEFSGPSETNIFDSDGQLLTYSNLRGAAAKRAVPVDEQNDSLALEMMLPAHTVFEGVFYGAIATQPTDDSGELVDVNFNQRTSIPLSGEPLECGTYVSECVNLEGNQSLTVTAPHSIGYCQSETPSISFTVRSEQQAIDRVDFYVNGQFWSTYCVGCNPDNPQLLQVEDFPLTGLPSSARTVTIVANGADASSCSAFAVTRIEPPEPRAMICPSSITANDLPQPVDSYGAGGIAAEVVEPLLQPQWRGLCADETPPTVLINGPERYAYNRNIQVQLETLPADDEPSLLCDVPVYFERQQCVTLADSPANSESHGLRIGDLLFSNPNATGLSEHRPANPDNPAQSAANPFKGVYLSNPAFVSLPMNSNKVVLEVVNGDVARDIQVTPYIGISPMTNAAIDIQDNEEKLEQIRRILGPNILVEPSTVTLEADAINGVLISGGNELYLNRICY